MPTEPPLTSTNESSTPTGAPRSSDGRGQLPSSRVVPELLGINSNRSSLFTQHVTDGPGTDKTYLCITSGGKSTVFLRPTDAPNVVCDASKFRAATGWAPHISFEQSLQDLLEYERLQVQ